MIKYLLIIMVLLSGCYIDEDKFTSTPLMLVFPNGKSWEVQELIIDETVTFVSDTDTVSFSGNITYLFDQSDNLFFYNPVGSDPNGGRIETYYIYGTWKCDILSNNLEYLTINFPTNGGYYHRYSFLNNRWRVVDKWSNKIEMSDDHGRYLTIVVK